MDYITGGTWSQNNWNINRNNYAKYFRHSGQRQSYTSSNLTGSDVTDEPKITSPKWAEESKLNMSDK